MGVLKLFAEQKADLRQELSVFKGFVDDIRGPVLLKDMLGLFGMPGHHQNGQRFILFVHAKHKR